MIFSSATFLIAFFPVVTGLYFLCKNRVYRNVILLLASLVFYAWGEPKFVLVMLLSAFVAYVGGLLIARGRGKKAIMIATVVILVGILFVFKYLNFFADTVNAFSPGLISLKAIALPIGISFYTFQILSYVVDLYRGKVALQKNFFYLLLYVCFFPQLIAGPIVRYETVEYEIRHRQENWSDFVRGLERFVFGLSKKVLLANHLALVADGIFAAGVEEAGTLLTWVAALAYTFQIYFDFSGYSDMAIGMGWMFGFHFLENFNYPYTALSITDFWRRWHISLSSWFRDYVYIPLGGSRVGKSRHIFNLLVVWALTGFWHGAQWNFLLWGLYYAVLLILEKFVLDKALKKLPKALRWGYTFLLTIFGWIIFYQPTVAGMAEVVKTMFVYDPGDFARVMGSNSTMIPALLALPVACVFSAPVFRKFCTGEGTAVTALRELVCVGLLLACILCIVSSNYNPFIYFRF